ncbi:MAG: hypothetical protein RR536_01885 [Anaerovoracaceae bacterium]
MIGKTIVNSTTEVLTINVPEMHTPVGSQNRDIEISSYTLNKKNVIVTIFIDSEAAKGTVGVLLGEYGEETTILYSTSGQHLYVHTKREGRNIKFFCRCGYSSYKIKAKITIVEF